MSFTGRQRRKDMGRVVVGGKKLREEKGGNIDEEYEVAEKKEQVESVV